MTQRHVFPILLAVAAAIPAIVQAQPPLTAAAIPQVTVTQRDLDLTDAKDVKALHDRVHRTVESLCANDGARDLKSKELVRACVEGTVADTAHAEARAIAQAENKAAAVREALALARR